MISICPIVSPITLHTALAKSCAKFGCDLLNLLRQTLTFSNTKGQLASVAQ
ncbi:hypothetical protein ALT1644_380034 [Alteromonas macleodii]